MDDLQLVKAFRTNIPEASAEVREGARATLVARIGPGRSTRLRLPRRRRPLLVALAVLIAALAAGSSLGLGDRLVDLIAGKPAPPRVKKHFAQSFPDVRAIIPYFDRPGVIASKTHGVMVVRTSAGPVVLWAAPTRSGSKCWLYQFLDPKTGRDKPGGLGGGCGPLLWKKGQSVVADVADTGWGVGVRRLTYVWGFAAEGVAVVRLRLDDGTAKRMALAEGFVFAEVPHGRRAREAVALDRRGRILSRYSLNPLDRPRPPRPPRAYEIGPYRRVARTRAAGRTLTLEAAPASSGGFCLNLRVKPNGGETLGCAPSVRPGPLGGVALVEQAVPPPAYALFFGWVGSEVRRLELRYEDGRSVRVPLYRRFVLHAIPAARARPVLLLARDRSGRVVGRLPLGQAG